MPLKIGGCGFPVARARYFQEFSLVEIQQTFYHPPGLATAEKWRQGAPADFDFTMKAWQLITHDPKSPTYRRLKAVIPEDKKSNYGFFKPTEEVMSAWETTSQIARALGVRVVIFQCPAAFAPTKENKDNLARFFKKVNRGNFRFAWEPRGDWDLKEVAKLCEELDLIYCLDPFKGPALVEEVLYFRLHGVTGYRHNYSDAELSWLKAQCPKTACCYVLFNNIYRYDNALRFKNICPEAGQESRARARAI